MLTSLQNPVIKQLRKLHAAKERQAQGLFLVEGTHPVAAALAGGWELEFVCATEAWVGEHPAMHTALSGRAGRYETVAPAVIEALADTVHPSGVVAAVRRRADAWRPLLERDVSLLVLGERLQDPGNVGTLVRSCAAVGADGLVLSADSVDPDHPKVLRASAGLWFRSPPLSVPDLTACVADLVRRGVQVLAADAGAGRSLWECDLRRPTAFVLGSEGQGLSEPLRRCLPERVGIPLAPGVESLNVAVSGALLLFEAARQRRGSSH
ncbi:TrmH family RNA methyltransferase [Gloeobacter violaceus]|uniref:Gll0554 protein n=1 Tax=Gloeobacter violaceus (strain ATCC 29082 / PCC 7421) TaxID=251221 RepID=Q7NN60_GLOVI|nr:RNA methyltransferase [Gloeobacter violaceus]BAC88495.1 gll0554 [Gloeobacter violaceus PCC 7421]